MNWILLLLALFLISFEAIREGLKLKGKHILSSTFEFFYLAVITMICFAFFGNYNTDPIQFNYVKVLFGYLFLRYALFDVIYNLVIGQNIFFIGSTKLYDKFWRWFFEKTKFPEQSFLSLTKFIFLLIGVTWLIE